jgi:hypothetical protein
MNSRSRDIIFDGKRTIMTRCLLPDPNGKTKLARVVAQAPPLTDPSAQPCGYRGTRLSWTPTRMKILQFRLAPPSTETRCCCRHHLLVAKVVPVRSRRSYGSETRKTAATSQHSSRARDMRASTAGHRVPRWRLPSPGF